jgi:hypothetical protein
VHRKEMPEEHSEEKMERPRGLEPPPTAWQAVVLPLYYGRSDGQCLEQIFYSMPVPDPTRARTAAARECNVAEFSARSGRIS